MGVSSPRLDDSLPHPPVEKVSAEGAEYRMPSSERDFFPTGNFGEGSRCPWVEIVRECARIGHRRVTRLLMPESLFLRLAFVGQPRGPGDAPGGRSSMMLKPMRYLCLDCGCIVETRSRSYDGHRCPVCDSRLFLPWEKTAVGQMAEDASKREDERSGAYGREKAAHGSGGGQRPEAPDQSGDGRQAGP